MNANAVFKIFALVVAIHLGAATAVAEEWKNVGPISSGEMQAFVSYQVQTSIPDGDIWHGGTPMGPASYRNEAVPLWVNILAPALNASDRVFVQIISFEHTCYDGLCNETESISERSLEFASSGRFTGEMRPLTLAYQLNDGAAISKIEQYACDIVVWINGKLYKGLDGNNLHFSM